MIPDYSIFGKNLERILREKNMTQLEVSRKTGISQGSISGYCRGLHYPPTNLVQDIVEALNVNVGELFKPLD